MDLIKNIIISILFILIICIPYAQIEIPFTDVAPVIDGEFDSVWQNSIPININTFLPQCIPIPDSLDFFVNCYFLWNTDSLYIFVSVNDDIIRIDMELWYENDAIALYFDGGNEKSPEYDYNDVQLGYILYNTSLSSVWWPYTYFNLDDFSGCKFISKEKENGYNYEIALPGSDLWENLGINLNNNIEFGWEIEMIDSDNGIREHRLSWQCSSEVCMSPEWWDTARLLIINQVITSNIITDSIWYDSDYNGVESGTVDGSSSTVNFGSIVSYEWLVNGEVVATTPSAVIELPSGTNYIVLTLTSDLDTVKIDSQAISVYAADLNTNGSIISGVSQLNENLFFTSSEDDKIYSFDSTGSMKWVISTGGAIQSTICVGNEDNIYVGSSDTRLYSFDYLGIPQWDKPMGGIIVSSPSIGPDSTIYVGITSGRLFAVSKSGTILWGLQTGGPITSSASINENGVIYFGSEDGKVYAVSDTGDTVWTFTTGNSISSSAAIGADSTIVIGSNDGYLYKIDESGDQVWNFNTYGAITSSPVIGAHGEIIIGSESGYIYKIDQDGDKIWQYDAGTAVTSTAAIGQDGNIYVGLENGRFIALSENGDFLWYLKTQSKVLSPPLVTPNNTIFIGSTDNNVYIMKDPTLTLYKKTDQPILEWPTFKGNNQRTGYRGNIIDQTPEQPEPDIPVKYFLSQNYPNPFNQSTKIKFDLIRPGHVKIIIYNILGEKIETLLNRSMAADYHEVEFTADNLAAGIYFYRIQAGEFQQVKKMILLR